MAAFLFAIKTTQVYIYAALPATNTTRRTRRGARAIGGSLGAVHDFALFHFVFRDRAERLNVCTVVITIKKNKLTKCCDVSFGHHLHDTHIVQRRIAVIGDLYILNRIYW